MKLRTTKKDLNSAHGVYLAFPAAHYPLLADLFFARWYITNSQGLEVTQIAPIGNTSYAIVTGIDTSQIQALHADQYQTLAELCQRWENKLNEALNTQACFRNIAEYQTQFEKDFRDWILANYTTAQMS